MKYEPRLSRPLAERWAVHEVSGTEDAMQSFVVMLGFQPCCLSKPADRSAISSDRSGLSTLGFVDAAALLHCFSPQNDVLVERRMGWPDADLLRAQEEDPPIVFLHVLHAEDVGGLGALSRVW